MNERRTNFFTNGNVNDKPPISWFLLELVRNKRSPHQSTKILGLEVVQCSGSELVDSLCPVCDHMTESFGPLRPAGLRSSPGSQLISSLSFAAEQRRPTGDR